MNANEHLNCTMGYTYPSKLNNNEIAESLLYVDGKNFVYCCACDLFIVNTKTKINEHSITKGHRKKLNCDDRSISQVNMDTIMIENANCFQWIEKYSSFHCSACNRSIDVRDTGTVNTKL